MQHQVQDWHDWRYAIANNDDKTLQANAAYNNNRSDKWAEPKYDVVQRLYVALVDYQCDVQATMIGYVYDRVVKVNSNFRMIIFPPQQGPTVYGKTEYTLDMSLNGLSSSPKFVWEFADWDNRPNATSALVSWAKQADAVSADYFFTPRPPKYEMVIRRFRMAFSYSISRITTNTVTRIVF